MQRKLSFKGDRGQTVTELAVVLPILALLLFGIIQFGIVFNHYLTITDAARTGARKAAVGRHIQQSGGNAAAAAEAQVRASASELDQADLDVVIDVPGGWAQGADVEVTASYPYEINLLGIPVTSGRVSSTTTERIE